MRLRILAACVAVSICLTATAVLGSNWTAGNGGWDLGGNWDAGVPNGTSAFIGNGSIVTLDTGVPAITTLDVQWFSTLNIQNGAGLTASGDANVAGGGNDWGTVNQGSGVVLLENNLTLAGASGDIASWTMTADGSLEIANDLVVGDNGEGVFRLGGNSSLTVGGNIDIGRTTGGTGTMTLTGGALSQTGGVLGVGDGGSLEIKGDTPVINVVNYEQGVGGSLNLELNDFGVSPINISNDMTLAGSLNVSIASDASVAPGIYDILIAESVRTGKFGTANLPEDVAVRYEVADGNYVTRLYVDVPPPPPAGAGETISVNTTWVSDVATIDTELTSGEPAGVVNADLWNNVDVSAGTTVIHHHGTTVKEVDVQNLMAQAGGATAVRMKLGARQPCQPGLGWIYETHGSPVPEQNSAGTSPDHKVMHAGPASWTSIAYTGSGHQRDYMQLELSGLAEQYPNGYDVILYFGDGGHLAANQTGYTVVTGPNTYSADTEVTPFGTQIPGSWDNMQDELPPVGPNVASAHGWSNMRNSGSSYNYSGTYVLSADENTPGNYHIISGQMMDTLTLTFVPDDSTLVQPNVFTLLGFQLRETTTAPEPMEFIVDNLDFPEFWSYTGGIKSNSNVNDAWREYSSGHVAWYGREGTACVWETPYLPFEEPTEYEVFTWIASEKPSAPGTYYDRDANAVYTIKHAFGEETFVFDQHLARGQGWVSLGKWFFTGDAFEFVKIESGSGADGPITSYDAVRWLWTPPPQEQAVTEPGSLGLIGLALLAVRKRRS